MIDDDSYQLQNKKRRGGINLDFRLDSRSTEQKEEKSVLQRRLDRKLADLHYPVGLKPRPLTAGATPKDIESRLQGLPGSLELDNKKTTKYFGDEARNNFFNRYQWLNRQRAITAHSTTEELDSLYFEIEKEENDVEYPFKPIRSIETLNQNSTVSFNQQIPRNTNRFQDRFRNMSKSEAANEDFLLRASNDRSGGSPLEYSEDETKPSTIFLTDDHISLDDYKGNSEPTSPNRDSHFSPLNSENPSPKRQSPIVLNPPGSPGSLKKKVSFVRSVPTDTPKESVKPLSKAKSSSTVSSGDLMIRSNSPELSSPVSSSGPSSPNGKRQRSFQMATRASIAREQELMERFPQIKNKSVDEVGDSEADKNGSQEPTEDLYSAIILEHLMKTKRQASFILSSRDSGDEEDKNELNIGGLREERDDESINTFSTISTLGLLLGKLEESEIELNERSMEMLQLGSKLELNVKTRVKRLLLEKERQKEISRGTIASPRTKYLSGCLQEQVNPRPSLILRRNMTKQLNLQHQGMGDQMGRLLANSIKTLPFIQSINITDNMLTDEGLEPILSAAVGIPGLLELNLSQNQLGPRSAKALFAYLQTPICPLERLIMNSANVDDDECGRFVEAIKQNKSLVELDLSHNNIGNAENLNTVMPNLITGSESIASFLADSKCNLKSLRLDWNMIRLGGGIAIAKSIEFNATLTYLDLSYNTLGAEGGMTLGVSMLKNRTLETLVLVNNSLDARACFTICAGVIENRGLKKVVLDGNPIGEQGLKALMLVPLIVGNRVKISAARCNVSIKDSRCWFCFETLIGEYHLNMENGYERAIALILLHLVAGHHTYIFSTYSHEIPRAGKQARNQKISLKQEVSKEHCQYFDEEQKAVIEGLTRLKQAAADVRLAIKLFQQLDEDGDGGLDQKELHKLMDRMGITLTEQRLSELFTQFDVDMGGKIEIHEFFMMLKSQHEEANARIREIMETPIMTSFDDGVRYHPPENGVLHVTVVDAFAQKSKYRIMSSIEKETIVQIAKDVGEGGGGSVHEMVAGALHNTKLRLDEALSVAHAMVTDSRDKVTAVQQLLSQMNHAGDARHLISSLLGDDRKEMLRLKRMMGAALRPILGNPNGYYSLDMSKKMDRMCFERLLEISTTSGVRRAEDSKIGNGRVGDLSQHGNWSSFRNEMFEGQPISITPAFAQPTPQKGRLEFDFSGDVRPIRDVMVVHDMRLVKTLLNIGLLAPESAALALYKLKISKRRTERTLTCDGHNYIEFSADRARMVGENIEDFYLHLGERNHDHHETIEKECNTDVELLTGLAAAHFEVDNRYYVPKELHSFVRDEAEVENIKINEAANEKDNKASSNNRNTIVSKVKKGKKSKRKSSAKASRRGTELRTTTQLETKTPTVVYPLECRKEKDALAAIYSSDEEGSEDSSSDGSSTDEDDDDEAEKEALLRQKKLQQKILKLQRLNSFQMASSKALSFKISIDNLDDEDDDDSNFLATPSSAGASVIGKEGFFKQDVQKIGRNIQKASRNKLRSSFLTAGGSIFPKRKNIAYTENFLKIPEADEFLQKLKQILANPTVPVGTKARRIVNWMEETFSGSFIYARHLALILECFVNFGIYKHTRYHGSYRVELVVCLFSRVQDIHNFEVVSEVLTPWEMACVYCRIGWLNIHNPCKPDGSWELDLSRREERVVAKTLCCLATHEPGDNWAAYSFRWQRTMDPMPGWELTQPWLTEDGMPMRGLLSITYYSGEGKRYKGCKPYVSFRKSLLNMFLINEDEIVNEDLRTRAPLAVLPGDKAFVRHMGLWETYLAPITKEKRKR